MYSTKLFSKTALILEVKTKGSFGSFQHNTSSVLGGLKKTIKMKLRQQETKKHFATSTVLPICDSGWSREAGERIYW
jgi:hypothetical protein